MRINHFNINDRINHPRLGLGVVVGKDNLGLAIKYNQHNGQYIYNNEQLSPIEHAFGLDELRNNTITVLWIMFALLMGAIIVSVLFTLKLI